MGSLQVYFSGGGDALGRPWSLFANAFGGIAMSPTRCMECGQEKPVLAVEQEDDFCSTACARRHHGMGQAERLDRPLASSRRTLTRSSTRALVTSGSSKNRRTSRA